MSGVIISRPLAKFQTTTDSRVRNLENIRLPGNLRDLKQISVLPLLE